MVQDSRTEYISFHKRDQTYTIDFLGGPLDGASIETDERPSCNQFTHQLNGRAYAYYYEEIGPNHFHAKSDMQRVSQSSSPRGIRSLLSACKGLLPWLVLSAVVLVATVLYCCY